MVVSDGKDVTRGKQKLKFSFPGALGQTQEKRHRHEGELGHATIAPVTMLCLVKAYPQLFPNTSEEI